MAQARDFPVLFPLYDITIYDLNAASTGVQSPVTGSQGASGDNTYIEVTANTIPGNTSALPSGLGAEVLFVECISPVVTNGGAVVYPDFQWSPQPDGVDLSSPTPANRCFIDGSYGGNMCPPRAQTVGRQRAGIIGVSLRSLLNDARNGKRVGSMATKATGWKYISTFQAKLYSKRGWGASVSGDTVQTPARLIFWGERYTDRMLAPLAASWNGAFSITSLRRYLEQDQVPMTLSGVQGGTVTVADLPTLSGGYQQRGDVIFRDMRFAVNDVATASSSAFPLTNSQQAGGKSGNVSTSYSSDLGFPFAPVNGQPANAKSAVILQKLGIIPGIANLAYFGLDFGGTLVPDPNGWPVGENVDLFAYGQVQDLRNQSELYYSIPDLENEIVVYGENAAVFVAGNGTAIASGDASVAEVGVAVQTSGAVAPGRQA